MGRQKQTNGPVGRPRRATSLLLVLAAILLLGGCGDSPEDRYHQAVEAAKNAEDVEDYLLFFTAQSADLLRSVHATNDRAGRWKYIDDVRDLLVDGEVVDKDEVGTMTVLTVESGKGKKQQVRMIKEGGFWKIDALALDKFWKPLEDPGAF